MRIFSVMQHLNGYKALLFVCLLYTWSVSGSNQFVEQEINYYAPNSSEVFLVWGINGWNHIPEEMLTPHTKVANGLLHTSMSEVNDTFTTTIKVHLGDVIDYVFWITKSDKQIPMDFWDTNAEKGKDYHLKALGKGPVFIQANFNKASGNAKFHILDLGFYMFALFLLLLIMLWWMERKWPNSVEPTSYITKILFVGLSLYLFHLFIRVTIVDPELISIHSITWISAGYHDLIYVGLLTTSFLLAGLILKKQIAKSILIVSFWLISAISLIVALANIDMVANLGGPFNYQWFYYSDFLNSTEAKDILTANNSFLKILKGISFCAAALLFARFLIKLYALSKLHQKLKLVFNAALILLLIVISAQSVFGAKNWNKGKLENPVIAFVISVFQMQSQSSLFSMDVSKLYSLPEVTSNQSVTDSINPIKNVLLIVLESAGAEYFDLYGGRYNVTPALNRYFNNSVLFENIYAHAPATNKSLVSLLCSIYPWVSYQSLTKEKPDFDFPSLSSELSQRGYKTSFFTSSDFRFQRGDEFLCYRQFDVTEDFSSISCDEQFFMESTEYTYGDGIDDECVIDRFIEWIDADTSAPFFSMLWTMQGHYPYFISEEEKDYNVKNSFQNRYLNAIKHYDEIIDKVIRQLDERNRLQNTLIVIVGDHGEAFGRHGQHGHGSGIYEENIHVPLIMYNPLLFSGERRKTFGGLKDVSSTIMGILNYSQPTIWQGRNLFDNSEANQVFFFAPWSDYLFGSRKGYNKIILNESSRSVELYDLSKDTLEERNIAEDHVKFIETYREEVAAWIQYQDNFIKQVLDDKKLDPIQ